ncbi:MAG TPA: hypothetical protein DCR93_23260, partial [Cytophagales bacterium]|nr:hypothetical protein [Cytophagales bacterium]
MPWNAAYTGPVPDDNPTCAQSFPEIVTTVAWYQDFFQKQNHPLGYFAALYGKVSREIEEYLHQGKFQNQELFTQMDLLFVTRYLQAMDAYLHGKETTMVWKMAIRGTERSRPTVLQHLLAALNAHVNLDLPAASAQAAPGKLIEDFEQDFMTVNGILYSMMDRVQTDLGEVFKPMRRWNRLVGTLDDRVLKVGLYGARSLAWMQAEQFAHSSPKDFDRLLNHLDIRFTEIGRA